MNQSAWKIMLLFSKQTIKNGAIHKQLPLFLRFLRQKQESFLL